MLSLAVAAAVATAPPCVERSLALGPAGRASVVAFDGPLSHATICATVANLNPTRLRASLGSVPDGAVVAASLGTGSGASLTVSDGTIALADGARQGARDVGPWALAPGGVIPAQADVEQRPRVVLGYAGDRIFVIAFSAIDPSELARSLRDRTSALGADTPFERAVVLDGGPAATLYVKALDGTTAGAPPAAAALAFLPR